MSRNYTEDQNNELEALESIYFDEIQIIDEEKRNKFKINVYTEGFRDSQDGLSCDLLFTYTPKYPDEKPIFEIENENFELDTRKEVMEALNSCVEENLGSEMIFGLVGTTQDLLNNLFDQIKDDREKQLERSKREAEELEMKKFEGTRVTVESFMKWRIEFEADMGIAEKKAKENEANKKLTGRELFLKDQSLLDSDIRFLTENGDSIENVKIDESLFQNLDLEENLPSDDESDDPDWKPS